MKILALSLALSVQLNGQTGQNQQQKVTWTKAQSGLAMANGYNYNRYAPSLRKTIFHALGPVHTGTVTCIGASVSWASGDLFAVSWGALPAATGIVINGVSKTIVAGTVTSTAMTLTTSCTSGTYTATPGAIYSNHIYLYDSQPNTFSTNGPGSDDINGNCSLDTPTQPGQRHPTQQSTIDTIRNYYWLGGGVNSQCVGPRPDTNPHQDLYYMDLNVDPPAWTQVTPAHFPTPSGTNFEDGTLWHDSAIDALFYWGSPTAHPGPWIYCLGASPTPAQTAAGCTVNNDFLELTATGTSGQNCSTAQGSSNATKCPSVSHPSGYFDATLGKAVIFGGAQYNGSSYVPKTEVWLYDAAAKTFTLQVAASSPPAQVAGPSIMPSALLPGSRIYYHQYDGVGAPSDWIFDIASATWTQVTSVCSPTCPAAGTDGAAWSISTAYDASRNRIVGFSQQGAGNVWIGQFSGTPSPLFTGIAGSGVLR